MTAMAQVPTAPVKSNRAVAPQHQIDRNDIIAIAFVALAIVFGWLKLWQLVAPFDFFSLLATLLGGLPIFAEAWTAIGQRRMTMELSMTIALVAALCIGAFLTAAVIVLFVLIAEVIEKRTVSRGRRAIKELLDFLPQTALVEIGEQIEERAITSVVRGDIVIVKPGARIAVDGCVTEGHSFVDESTITGEATPQEKSEGAAVYAGSINQSGALHVRAESVGRQTAFGKIAEVVERAEESKAPIEKTADRLAGYLVYFAIGSAIITYLITHDARATISVIIVAGACGIAAGTPLAILGAIGQAARSGMIVKGGIYLEQLAHVDTVVFDKTGTLTMGKPEVAEIVPLNNTTAEQLVQIAASAEALSEHPLAEAIRRKSYAMGQSIQQPTRFEYVTGKGVCSTFDTNIVLVGSAAFLQERGIAIDQDQQAGTAVTTRVYVAMNGDLKGRVDIADPLRPEAEQMIAKLRRLGLQLFLFSGDTENVARAIASKLGIDGVRAGLLPEDKASQINKLKAAGRKVAMVGDGVNDAPALVTADVGIAIGSGTDVALESADMMLISNDLLRLADTFAIAKRCRSVIMTNFIGTIAIDGLGIVLAAFGMLGPALAAFIHVTSELLFIFNSARLLPVGKARTSSTVEA